MLNALAQTKLTVVVAAVIVGVVVVRVSSTANFCAWSRCLYRFVCVCLCVVHNVCGFMYNVRITQIYSLGYIRRDNGDDAGVVEVNVMRFSYYEILRSGYQNINISDPVALVDYGDGDDADDDDDDDSSYM